MAKKNEVVKTRKTKVPQYIERDLVDEMKESFLTYSVSKIKSALPCVFDGLTLVQRRILWAFYLLNKGKRTKTAHVVGTVMGEYHP